MFTKQLLKYIIDYGTFQVFFSQFLKILRYASPDTYRYGTRACRHACVSRSTDQAAFAGLVEGRQTAGLPLIGSM